MVCSLFSCCWNSWGWRIVHLFETAVAAARNVKCITSCTSEVFAVPNLLIYVMWYVLIQHCASSQTKCKNGRRLSGPWSTTTQPYFQSICTCGLSEWNQRVKNKSMRQCTQHFWSGLLVFVNPLFPCRFLSSVCFSKTPFTPLPGHFLCMDPVQQC